MSRESFGFHGVHTISEGGHSPPYNFVISTRFFHNAYEEVMKWLVESQNSRKGDFRLKTKIPFLF